MINNFFKQLDQEGSSHSFSRLREFEGAWESLHFLVILERDLQTVRPQTTIEID